MGWGWFFWGDGFLLFLFLASASASASFGLASRHARAVCSDGLGWKMCTRIRVCAITGGLRFMVLVRRNGCWIMTAGGYLEVGFFDGFFLLLISSEAGDNQRFGGLASRESSVPTPGSHLHLFLARLWFEYRP